MEKKSLLIILLIVGFISGFLILNKPKDNNEVNKPPVNKQQQNPQPLKTIGPPKIMIDKTKNYSAVLDSSEGQITIQLNAKQTPITVNNFVYLSNKGFYNKTVFHRVIKGFMIQGGDPNGDGTGGPGYRFNDEPFSGQYLRGTVAMANAGPNTNGSQFFILHQNYNLPHNYVIFGQVIKGLDVIDKIATAPVKTGLSGEESTPVNPVVIKTITIKEE